MVPHQIPAEPVDPLRELERSILISVPSLVRAHDRLAEVRDDLLPGQVLAGNLEEAAAPLRCAGVPFALVLDRGLRHRMAIPPGNRADVLSAFAKAFIGRPVYADLLGHGRTLRTVLAEQLPEAVAEWETVAEPDDEERERVKGVRLYRPAVTSGGTLFYGADHGCDVEFWDSAEPSQGAVASIAETPFGWWLPSLDADRTTRIGEIEYPVVTALAESFPDDIDFPIDAVITWVDDNDPAWQARRAAANPDQSEDDGDHRYHNRDELRYCLRSIAMYAPWIRRIFLVTDGQTPDWLDTEDPRLTVVFHSDLFPDSPPVFNSHAIETQLHRIPGLAEHFLYFNDDMFLGRALHPQTFFQGNGVPLLFRDQRVIPPAEPHTPVDVYVAAQQTTRQAVERELGRTFTQVLSHAPYPLRRSLLTEAATRWPAELTATSRSTFRAATDVAPVTLATYYAYLTARAANGTITHHYLPTDRTDSLARLDDLLTNRHLDIFCLADGPADELPRDEQDHTVVEFLRAYFPVPGPFELKPPELAAGKSAVAIGATPADGRAPAPLSSAEDDALVMPQPSPSESISGPSHTRSRSGPACADGNLGSV